MTTEVAAGSGVEQPVEAAPAVLSCDVWWARTDELLPEHFRLLPPGDVARLERFRRPADRARGALAAVLSRLAVAELMHVQAAAVEVTRHCARCGGAHGKMRVVGGPEVSVAHSGDVVAVATSTAAPVGVDVEFLGRLPRLAGDHAAQLTMWTRREAVAKATGDGLEAPLDDIEVTGADEPARFVAWRGRPSLCVQLIDLQLLDDYVGALAVLSRAPVVVRHRPANPLLRRALSTIAPERPPQQTRSA